MGLFETMDSIKKPITEEYLEAMGFRRDYYRRYGAINHNPGLMFWRKEPDRRSYIYYFPPTFEGGLFELGAPGPNSNPLLNPEAKNQIYMAVWGGSMAWSSDQLSDYFKDMIFMATKEADIQMAHDLIEEYENQFDLLEYELENKQI